MWSYFPLHQYHDTSKYFLPQTRWRSINARLIVPRLIGFEAQSGRIFGIHSKTSKVMSHKFYTKRKIQQQ